LGVSLAGWYDCYLMQCEGPSHNSSLTYNLFQENIGYGLSLGSSFNCTIHHNSFIDNNLGGTSQASDEGEGNIWYDNSTKEGNFWSDYSDSGNYTIYNEYGDPVSFDLYPLSESPLIFSNHYFHLEESKSQVVSVFEEELFYLKWFFFTVFMICLTVSRIVYIRLKITLLNEESTHSQWKPT
jgi:parallel beta-helix repeat protein